MSTKEDILSKYYLEEAPTEAPKESVAESNDPLNKYLLEPEAAPEKKKREPERHPEDLISKNLREQGYEPDFSEEMQRIQSYGEVKALPKLVRGGLSGATFGASEYIPGFETEDEDVTEQIGKFAGSFVPIAKLYSFFSGPVVNLARKTPIIGEQLASLTNLVTGGLTGVTYNAAEQAVQGKVISTDDVIKYGAEWTAIDLLFRSAGKTYELGRALDAAVKETGESAPKIVNQIIDTMGAEGIDLFSPSSAEKTQATFLANLERIGGEKASQELRKVTNLGEEVFQGLEENIQNLKNTKVSPKTLEPLTGNAAELAEPYIPKGFSAAEIIEQSANAEVAESIRQIANRAPTERQLGENVRASINSRIAQAQDIYRPAYQLAEEAASLTTTTAPNTGRVATEIMQNLESFNTGTNLATQPTGYRQTIGILENVLEDAGFTVQRNANGTIERVLSTRENGTDKLMEVGRRLNKMIAYDELDYNVKDNLKNVVRAIKQDVRSSLSQTPDALELYNQAEQVFQEQAQTFGRDSIRNIRTSDTPEKVAKLIRTPSGLADVKSAVSEGQFKEIERELMEYMNTLPEDKAAKLYRELGPSLSADTQVVAEEILQAKAPPATPGRSERINAEIQEKVLTNLTKSSMTGERPKMTLDLWKTERGQQLVKNALKDNPNKAEILEYLQDQSFYDFSSSFVEADGGVNFKKLGELMKDPATISNIEAIGGKEAVNYFKNLQKISSEIEGNVNALSDLKQDKSKISKALIGKEGAKGRKELEEAAKIRGEPILKRMAKKDAPIQVQVNDFIKNLDPNTKVVLGMLGVFHAVPVAKAYAGYKILLRIAKSKGVRNAISKIATAKKGNPKQVVDAVSDLNTQLIK